MSRPKILLTNDDGIFAPGIKTLWKIIQESNMADLVVIAPATERSGSGVSITWDRPLLIQKNDQFQDTAAWSVDGTPADCVKMASKVILKYKPDLIVSGINAGSNAGRNVLHSGTVGAVVEGIFRGIPGIAFSCENGDSPNFHVAEKYVVSLIRYVLKYPLNQGSFLNVNFPQNALDEVKGFRMASQGKGRWGEDPYLHIETEHGASYWLGGKPEESSEDADCDIALLRQGYLTAVPIKVHDLTDHKERELRKEEFETFMAEERVEEEARLIPARKKKI